MPLVKVFDSIHTVADKAYLAHCTCEGDVCQCSHDDGQDLFHTLSASNSNKDSEMSTIIDKMSAVERAKLADTISAAAPHMNEKEIKDLLVTLTAALGNDTIKASKADDRRKTIINNVMAARVNAKGTMTHIDGALRRECDAAV